MLSYTRIKRRAKRLALEERKGSGGATAVECEIGASEDQDWDLGLTLRTAEYNWAKLERLLLKGTR